MSVQVVQGGGGGFMDALAMASMFIPGMQAFAPYISAANSLMKGNVAGAAGSLIAPAIGGAMDSSKAAAATGAANRDSLFDALTNAHRRGNGWENYAEGLQQSAMEREMEEYLKKTEFQRRWR